MRTREAKRPAKRDVIDISDDEAKREQPTEKIVKKEAESVPSSVVLQLQHQLDAAQQQLLNSDKKFKRVCEMAGEYKARVEFLEKIIDSKKDIVGNANSAESVDELRNKVAELTKQLEEREGRMRDQERFTQHLPTVMIQPPPRTTGSQIAIVDGYMGESLLKKEEMDFDFEVDNANPIEEPSDEQPSNDADSHGNMVPSDVMGEDMNPIEDPDSSEDEVKKRTRPTRTSSRVIYSESDDESEPEVKKPTKARRVTKINDTELKCPKCEYCSKSVRAWFSHLKEKHATNPRELNLALLCKCGIEAFSTTHSQQCDMASITIVRKSATPQCVMCEAFPKTPTGYVTHLKDHHKTTLIEQKIFLECRCGLKLTCYNQEYKHTKKCNGHEYSIHKVEEKEEGTFYKEKTTKGKNQKRQERKAEDRKKAVEAAAVDSEAAKTIEMSAVVEVLVARGLSLVDIPPDGDCLYHAVAHQLNAAGAAKEWKGADLRRKAAAFIRAHVDDFLPFLATEDGDCLDEMRFEEYCVKVEREASNGGERGGEPELRALADALERKIEVVQPDKRVISFGEAFSGRPLVITYHRHAYNLGEHYNSTVTMTSTA